MAYQNIAYSATATASSENSGAGQQAVKAINSITTGGGSQEWVVSSTAGGVWITLTWSHPVVIDKVVLFDRVNTTDNVLTGTLTFSDSSTPIPTGALPTDGAASTYNFTAKTVTWVKLTVDTFAGSNPGLAEFQAWGDWQSVAFATNIALTGTATASSEQSGSGQTASKAIDGVIDGYPGDYTKEWAASTGGAGAWLQINWSVPITMDRVTLYDRPNPTDNIEDCQLTFSDSSTVPFGMLPVNGSGRDVRFAARSATWVRMTTLAAGGVGLAEFQVWGAPTSAVAGNVLKYASAVKAGTASALRIFRGAAVVYGIPPVVSLYSGNPSPTADQAIDGNTYTLGSEFYVTKTAWVYKVRYLQPTIGTLAQRTMAIYSVTNSSTGTKVGGNWSMPIPVSGQWCEYVLPTPLQLTANQRYRITTYHGGNVGFARTFNYFSTGANSTNQTYGGYLVHPSAANTTGGTQGTFNNADAFPTSGYLQSTYYSDVVVSDFSPG